MIRIRYITVGLVALAMHSRAQLYIQDGATLHTDAQATLVVNGDVRNKGVLDNTGTTSVSGNVDNEGNSKIVNPGKASINVAGNISNQSTIENDGSIDLMGNFDNQNTCTSRGHIFLSGKDQTFYHKNTSISNLSVNGGGSKKMTSDVTIEKKLELNEGYISPSSGTKFLMKDGSETSDGNAYSFVDGMLYWEGAKTHYYPIGKNDIFTPVEFQDIEGDNLTLGMEVINPADVEMTESKLTVNMVKSRYFKTDVAAGTFTQGYLALPYFGSDNLDPGMKIGVAQAAEAAGPYLMLKRNADKNSRISDTKLDYVVSDKPATQKYFTVANYLNADMSMLYVPNALSHFAPDSNDVAIRVYGDVFTNDDFLFTVSNQWGNLIFKTTSREEMARHGWDGTNKRTGRREMIGQYYFSLKATTLDGEKYETAGSVWIID